MANLVYVLHEKSDGEHCVIGVCDAVKKADKLIVDYYGSEFAVVNHHDVDGTNIEWYKTLEVLDHKNERYKVNLWLECFELNCA
jgi:hypothetical protein